MLRVAIALALSAPPATAAERFDLAASLRLRSEFVGNPQFALANRGEDAVLLARLLLDAEWRPDAAVIAHVQLASHLATPRAFGPRPTDRDNFDLQQGWVALRRGRLTLKAGRQELAFGSGRLVSARDGPNVRLSFDAARATLALGAARLEAFVGRPVSIGVGAFDDGHDSGTGFWGLYGGVTMAPDLLVEPFYLGLDRAAARFGSNRGREVRHSLGLRVAGRRGAIDWDWEAVWQFGRFDRSRINAWTLATDTGLALASRWRLGIKADIASGDAASGDRVLGTFNPLFPKLPYFSEANLVAPANVIDLHPSLRWSPDRRTTLTLGADWLWRHRAADAFYVPPLTPIGLAASGHYIGRQLILDGEMRLADGLSLAGNLTLFDPGQSLRRAGGNAGFFAMVAATIRF